MGLLQEIKGGVAGSARGSTPRVDAQINYSTILNEGGFRDKLLVVERFSVRSRQEWPAPIRDIADATFADAVVLDMRDLDRLAREVHGLAIIDTVPASVVEGETTVAYPAFTPDGVRAFGALAIIYGMMLRGGDDPLANKGLINIGFLTHTTRSWLLHHPLAEFIHGPNYQNEPAILIPWDGRKEEGLNTEKTVAEKVVSSENYSLIADPELRNALTRFEETPRAFLPAGEDAVMERMGRFFQVETGREANEYLFIRAAVMIGLVHEVALSSRSPTDSRRVIKDKDDFRLLLIVAWQKLKQHTGEICNIYDIVREVLPAVGEYRLEGRLREFLVTQPRWVERVRQLAPTALPTGTVVFDAAAAEQVRPEFGFSGPFWETELGQSVRTFADNLAKTMPHHVYANKVLGWLQLKSELLGIVGYLVKKGILTGRDSSDWKFNVELPQVLTIGLILLYRERGYELSETSQRLGELLAGTSLRQFIGSINSDSLWGRGYPNGVFNPSSPWLSFPLESVRRESAGPESDLTIVPAPTASPKERRQGMNPGDGALADFLAHQRESELSDETGQGGVNVGTLPDGKKIEEILSGLSWSNQEAVDFKGLELSGAEIKALLLLSAPRHIDEIMAGYDITVTHAQLRNELERYLQGQAGRQRGKFL